MLSTHSIITPTVNLLIETLVFPLCPRQAAPPVIVVWSLWLTTALVQHRVLCFLPPLPVFTCFFLLPSLPAYTTLHLLIRHHSLPAPCSPRLSMATNSPFSAAIWLLCLIQNQTDSYGMLLFIITNCSSKENI